MRREHSQFEDMRRQQCEQVTRIQSPKVLYVKPSFENSSNLQAMENISLVVHFYMYMLINLLIDNIYQLMFIRSLKHLYQVVAHVQLYNTECDLMHDIELLSRYVKVTFNVAYFYTTFLHVRHKQYLFNFVSLNFFSYYTYMDLFFICIFSLYFN